MGETLTFIYKGIPASEDELADYRLISEIRVITSFTPIDSCVAIPSQKGQFYVYMEAEGNGPPWIYISY